MVSGAPAVAAEPEGYKPIVECKAALIVFRQVGQIPAENYWAIYEALNNAAYRVNEPGGMSWEKSASKLNTDGALLYTHWQFKARRARFIKLANQNFQSCVTAIPESVELLKWR
jgi:hypothetical protein